MPVLLHVYVYFFTKAFDRRRIPSIIAFFRMAHVAELVDAHGSGPCAARCGGSNPSVGTKSYRKKPADSSAGFFYGLSQSVSGTKPRCRLPMPDSSLGISIKLGSISQVL